MSEIGSLDCPDCQLQLLQQQQTQSQIPPLLSSSGSQSCGLRPENSLLGGGRPVPGEIGFPLIPKSTPYSQVESSNHPYQLPGIHQNIRAPSSSGGGSLNVYHYGSDYGPLNASSSSNPSPSLQFSGNPSTSVPPPHPGTDLNYSSTGFMEKPCDYHGYCSTCAVLELPGNDKYYSRSSNSRPHVFPPIFYSQGPSSVIPGFSSIGDWTNGEYYAYSKYSQTPSSVGPSMTADVYGPSSSSTPNPHSNSQHGASGHVPPSSPFDMFTSNNATSSMLQSSYANQRQHVQQPSSMFTASGGSETNTSKTTDYSHPHFSHHTVTSSTSQIVTSSSSQYVSESISSTEASFVVRSGTSGEKIAAQEQKLAAMTCSKDYNVASTSSPIPRISIPGNVPVPSNNDNKSQEQSSDSESSCDSESGDSSSMASEDRELISVVEEDDEDGDEMESTKGVRPGGKCFICHNPIEITDCSSPQLAKILENIEDDIAVDDLDMSGDIEIGGIEDYQGHKKRNASGGGQASGILSTSRLVILLGLSKNGFGSEAGIDHHDFAILCFRCGKLASMADTLERQLASTIQTLQQQLMTNNLNEIGSRPPSLNPLVMEKPVPLEEYHHQPVPSISPTLQFHQIRPLLHHKEVQTEWEKRSWGTQVPSTPMSTPMFILSNHESLDIGTQCCSNDFPEAQEIITNPSSTSTTSYANNEESPSSSEDSQSDSGQTHFFTGSNNDISSDENVLSTPKNLSSYDKNICSSPSINLPQDPLQEHTNSIGNEALMQSSNEKLPSDTHSSSGVTEFTKNNKDHMILDSIQNQISLSNACQSCQRVFSTKSNLRAHKKICKAGLDKDETVLKNVMQCSKCGVGFRNVLRHRVHMEEGCKALNFECAHCPRKFSKSSELKAHLNAHKGEKPFSCEKCRASFATKGNQMAHSKTHSDNKRFYCSHCDKGFNRRFALTIHLNRHNDINPFPCNLCNKSFPDPSYLTKHKRKTHVLEKAAT